MIPIWAEIYSLMLVFVIVCAISCNYIDNIVKNKLLIPEIIINYFICFFCFCYILYSVVRICFLMGL